MKIRFLKSISAKLFYYTAILVSAVIFAVSFQNSKSYQQMLLRTFQDSSLDRGENIRITLENFFSSLDSQLKITLATMLSVSQAQKETTAFNFLENNKRKFVSIQVFRQTSAKKAKSTLFQFTSELNNPAFESKDPKSIAKKIKTWNRIWLNRSLAKNPNDKLFLKSFASRLKLPIISYAKSYENGRTGQTYWAVLSIWQEPFFSLLDGTNDSEITIVDRDGRIFSSKDIESLKKGISLRRTKLYKKADSDVQGLGSAFIGSYKGRKGIRWLGSYQKIDSLGLIVFMEKNEDALIRDIDALVVRTAKWGLLFVLIALAFSAIGSTTITRNLKNVVNITQMIAKGDFSARIKPSSDDEIGYLSLSVNSMADRIGHLLNEKVEKARFEKELETANAVQNTLFPKKGLETSSLGVVGFSKPASECGGDWWGYFEHDNGKTFILIADAMGHGVPAALVTAMAYANCMSLQAIAKEAHLQSELSPKNFLERFNKVLFDAVEGSITMSFFALLVDTEAATITFANAGHNFPVLLPKDPDDPRITRKSKKLQKISPITPISLKESGSILGIDRDAVFNESTMPIKAGDKIFLFTDGLIECTSEQNKAWGRKGLINHLLTYCDRGATGLRDSIHKEAYAFYGNQPPIDDITMVVTEIKEVNTNPVKVEPEAKAEPAPAPAAEARAVAQAPVAPEPVQAPVAEAPVQAAEPAAPAIAPAVEAPVEPVAEAPVAEAAPSAAQAEDDRRYARQRSQSPDEKPKESRRLTDVPIPTMVNAPALVEEEPPAVEGLAFDDTAEDKETSYQICEEAETVQLEPAPSAVSLDLGDISIEDIDLADMELTKAFADDEVDLGGATAPPRTPPLNGPPSTPRTPPVSEPLAGPPPAEVKKPLIKRVELESIDAEPDKIKVSATNYLQTVDDPNKAFPGKSLTASDYDKYDRHMPSRKELEESEIPFAEEESTKDTDDRFQDLITHVDDMVNDENAQTMRVSEQDIFSGGADTKVEEPQDKEGFAGSSEATTSISISEMLSKGSADENDDEDDDSNGNGSPGMAS